MSLMASSSLIHLYETTRRDARAFGLLRLRWSVYRAHGALAADWQNEMKQIKVVALEQEAMNRGLLHSPSLPQRQGARRRVPPTFVSRFRRTQ